MSYSISKVREICSGVSSDNTYERYFLSHLFAANELLAECRKALVASIEDLDCLQETGDSFAYRYTLERLEAVNNLLERIGE